MDERAPTTIAPPLFGTAGHVDHGKSTLVKALTGTDPDRLREEKQRRISIRLGFAFLETPAGELAFVDVPGHERLVREMVAGAVGFEAVLLVVAADEGVMPQTREHLDVVELLGVRRGVVALTKVDLAPDEGWLALLEDDVRQTLSRTGLAGARIIRTSARTGEGLEELKGELIRLAEESVRTDDPGRPFRLAADRSFKMEGFGAVVTGTVAAGALRTGEPVEVQPGGGSGRVRGLQVNGRPREKVTPGLRAAVNLTGLSKRGVRRGDEIVTPGSVALSNRFDARVRLLSSAAELKSLVRLKLLKGTSELGCRLVLLDRESLKPGEETLAQIELERNHPVFFGERFILRIPSPPVTVAGGRVLDPLAQKHRRKRASYREALGELDGASPREALALWLKHNPLPRKDLTTAELAQRSNLLPRAAEEELTRLADAGAIVRLSADRWLHPRWRRGLVESLGQALDKVLEKRLPFCRLDRGRLSSLAGRNVEDGALRDAIAGLIEAGRLRPVGSAFAVLPRGEPTAEQKSRIALATRALEKAEENLPLADLDNLHPDAALDLAHYLEATGEAVLIGETHLWPAGRYEELRRTAIAMLKESGTLRVVEYKERAGLSRKTATLLLDHFHDRGLTRRESGTHVLLDEDAAKAVPLV
jgi:selenocysteine-specific elongation factor